MTEAASEREKRLKESHLQHAALAQLHLWLQQHDAAAGGSSAYFLKAADIQLRNGAAIAIDAQIECLNADAGDITRCTARCHAAFQPTTAVLPKIAEIRVAADARQHCDRFRPACDENRIRSLIHYFIALVEHPRHDPQPFRELLADPFSLNLVEPPIDSFAALSAWVAGPLSSVVAMKHVVGDLTLQRLGEHECSATVAMRSEALFPDGSGIASKTTQTWTVADDASAPFARIRKITIRRDEAHRF
jgi:hypothetical protein